jgi:hypothetical protein
MLNHKMSKVIFEISFDSEMLQRYSSIVKNRSDVVTVEPLISCSVYLHAVGGGGGSGARIRGTYRRAERGAGYHGPLILMQHATLIMSCIQFYAFGIRQQRGTALFGSNLSNIILT